jgi:hypothetical protein
MGTLGACSDGMGRVRDFHVIFMKNKARRRLLPIDVSMRSWPAWAGHQQLVRALRDTSVRRRLFLDEVVPGLYN